MLRSVGVTARTLVIFAFLLLMPLMALPPVAQWVEACVASCWTVAELAPPESAVTPPLVAEPTGNGDTQLPQSDRSSEKSIGVAKPTPDQQELSDDVQTQLNHEFDRLSRLGAQAMRWEQLEDGSRRFACNVPLDVGGVYARPFSAAESDPLASIRMVRGAIESWRQTLRDRQGSVDIEVGLHIPAATLRARRSADQADRPNSPSFTPGLP